MFYKNSLKHFCKIFWNKFWNIIFYLFLKSLKFQNCPSLLLFHYSKVESDAISIKNLYIFNMFSSVSNKSSGCHWTPIANLLFGNSIASIIPSSDLAAILALFKSITLYLCLLLTLIFSLPIILNKKLVLSILISWA